MTRQDDGDGGSGPTRPRRGRRTIDEIHRLEAALDDADVVVLGSRGQPRANGLVRELREHRLALEALLGATGIGLSDADGSSSATARSHAGRALARRRWGVRG